MDRETEVALIKEILALQAAKTPFLDEATSRQPASHYTGEDRFDAERERIFRRLPMVAAHISELASPGDFITREVAGRSILITRDRDGEIRGFLNTCRHRGTRLVDAASGCKHRFSCPYHAWTYANSGELIGAPHFDTGFPEHEKKDLGLLKVNTAVVAGLIWVWFGDDDDLHPVEILAPLLKDLEGLAMAEMTVAAETERVWPVNWKILVEGGIEAYHFKVAHKSTIGPFFEDNLSTYQSFSPHLRSVLPRATLKDLRETEPGTWRLRDHANILYTLFPNCQLLVQQDHIVWISSEPLAAGRTKLRIATLAPTTGEHGGNTAYWQRNHQITTTTLDEDFHIGASIQQQLESGGTQELLFGRFEGALTTFKAVVREHLRESHG